MHRLIVCMIIAINIHITKPVIAVDRKLIFSHLLSVSPQFSKCFFD
jgi:hypothetical protein